MPFGLEENDRIVLVEPLVNDDTTSVIKIESIPVGTEGTVTGFFEECGDLGQSQIHVKWDTGSNLSLLVPLDVGRWKRIE